MSVIKKYHQHGNILFLLLYSESGFASILACDSLFSQTQNSIFCLVSARQQYLVRFHISWDYEKNYLSFSCSIAESVTHSYNSTSSSKKSIVCYIICINYNFQSHSFYFNDYYAFLIRNILCITQFWRLTLPKFVTKSSFKNLIISK